MHARTYTHSPWCPLSLVCALVLILTPINVHAWGFLGHRIVATIAEAHLHPRVLAHLQSTLLSPSRPHLSYNAAWPDTIRRRFPETGHWHYVGALDDAPPYTCAFGASGFDQEDNVLTQLTNQSRILQDPGHHTVHQQDIALRFLVHLVGDLHNPLHLTARDRGGNQDFFRFDGRRSSLHAIWDSKIINDRIRDMSNYTSPTKNRRLEAALAGEIYDPYVRWIEQEMIRGWWRADILSWAQCPDDGDTRPVLHALQSASRPSTAHPIAWISYVISSLKHRVEQKDTYDLPPPERDDVVCPYYWASTVHDLNCPLSSNITGLNIWPQEGAKDLADDSYLGPVHRTFTVERLLATAGLRLAGALNSLYFPGGTDSDVVLSVKL